MAENDNSSIDSIATSISCAQFIIIAKLKSLVTGPVQMSFPPIRHYDLCFDDFRWFRRTNVQNMQFNSSTTFKFLDNSAHGIHLEEGTKYALAGNCQEEHGLMPVLSVVKPADGEITQLFMEMASVPVGWKRQIGGGWIYPAKVTKKPAWWSRIGGEGILRCVRTGRPALLVGNDKIQMTVKQIIPPDAEEKMAPYGDGEFALIVTNTDAEHEITVPALLMDADTGAISWEDSILIVDVETHHTFAPPGAGVRQNLVPYKLAPNTSVRATVNCLAIEGDEYWRSGGVRVYLLFCLGEICRENFFYYYGVAHEAKHNATIGKTMFT